MPPVLILFGLFYAPYLNYSRGFAGALFVLLFKCCFPPYMLLNMDGSGGYDEALGFDGVSDLPNLLSTS